MLWAKFDRDQSGSLNAQEAKNFIKELKSDMTDETVDEIFKTIDKDESGSIDKWEILDAI